MSNVDNTNRSNNCWLCGRKRGLAQRREEWSLNLNTVAIPRTDDPADKPAQTYNDLLIHVGVWRNGGADGTTHICDDCLRVALRAINVAVAQELDEGDHDFDIEREIVALTVRLAKLQLLHHNVCFNHNRMQDRLARVLDRQRQAGLDDDEDTRLAAWEVQRGRA